jgi:hypothetical protein
MPTNFQSLEMGPCNVTFKTVDLGLTMGGTDVTFGTEVADVKADQFGDTVIDQYIKGRSVKVKCPMAERDLVKLAAAFPGTTLITGLASAKKLVFKSGVGTSLRSLAGVLILHPKDAPLIDKSRDFTIPLAMAKGDMQFAYKHDQQRVYTLEFEGYVDLTTDELFTMGDPALVPV